MSANCSKVKWNGVDGLTVLGHPTVQLSREERKRIDKEGGVKE